MFNIDIDINIDNVYVYVYVVIMWLIMTLSWWVTLFRIRAGGVAGNTLDVCFSGSVVSVG